VLLQFSAAAVLLHCCCSGVEFKTDNKTSDRRSGSDVHHSPLANPNQWRLYFDVKTGRLLGPHRDAVNGANVVDCIRISRRGGSFRRAKRYSLLMVNMAPNGWNEFLLALVASGTEIYVDLAIGWDARPSQDKRCRSCYRGE
jgi:hypothetical protein